MEQPGECDLRHADAVRPADVAHDVHDVPRPLTVDGREVEAVAPGAAGLGGGTVELARQQAAGQRAPHHQAQALVDQQGRHLPLQAPPRHGVVGLKALEALEPLHVADPQRTCELPGCQVAGADGAHRTLAHQVVEGAKGGLQRRERVETVDLVEVQVVGLEPLQAAVHLVDDVSAAQPRLVDAGRHAPAHLAGQHHLAAVHPQVLEGLAQQPFAGAHGIDVGGVEEVHAAFERAPHQGGRLRLLLAADGLPDALAAEGHGAEAQLRDQRSGPAEGSIAHASLRLGLLYRCGAQPGCRQADVRGRARIAWGRKSCVLPGRRG